MIIKPAVLSAKWKTSRVTQAAELTVVSLSLQGQADMQTLCAHLLTYDASELSYLLALFGIPNLETVLISLGHRVPQYFQASHLLNEGQLSHKACRLPFEFLK